MKPWVERSSPICVIKLPDVCQLKCKYCFREYNRNIDKIAYSPTDLRNLLENYPEIKIISFLGGEPLIFKKFIKEVILETKDVIDKFIITTNGLLLTKEDVVFFFENHCQLNISLDGNEENNDSNRGKGVYKKVIEALNLIKDNTPPYYFWTISSTFPKDKIDTMYDSYLHIRTLLPRGWELNLDKYGEWTEEDLEKISKQLTLIRNHYETHPRTIKWFMARMFEKGIFYNHSDHLVIHPNGNILQGFPFTKEVLYSKLGEEIFVGSIFDKENLKPLKVQRYAGLRPCYNINCPKTCSLADREFYDQINPHHGRLLCQVYRTLLQTEKEYEEYANPFIAISDL